MTKFTLESLPQFDCCKIKVSRLFIDGKCQYDDFEKDILKEGTYPGELDSLQATLEQSCQLVRLPDNKFKKLKLGKLPLEGYEVKSRNLRLYLVHIKQTGRVIILGGKKTDQPKDIRRLKSLIKSLPEVIAYVNIK